MSTKKKPAKKKKITVAKSKKGAKKTTVKSKSAKKSVKPAKKAVAKAKKVVKKTAKKLILKIKKVVKKATVKTMPKPVAKSTVKKAAPAKPQKTIKIAFVPPKLVAKEPAKKVTAPPPSHNIIKSNLAELMPEYERQEEKIGDDYMNEAQKTHFRDLLNNWKKQLMQEVDRTVDHMKDEAANFPDPSDRATQEEEFSLELRTRDRERKLIKKIDEALERLDNDEYGYCEACGVEIGYKRLEARPTATLCIDCKTVDEIRERQLAS